MMALPTRLVAPLVSMAILSAGARAEVASTPGGIDVESRTVNVKAGATTCAYRVTNHGQKFVLRVQLPIGGRQVLDVPQVEHWFWTAHRQGARDDLLWLGKTADVAIGPKESVEFSVALASSKQSPVDCDAPHITLSTATERPAPPPPSALSLELDSPEASTQGSVLEITASVTLRNSGRGPELLNLGSAVGNSTAGVPRSIQLDLESVTGAHTLLHLKLPLGAGARADPMPLKLPPGTAYTLRQRWQASQPVIAGVYRLSARYEGVNPDVVNDGQAITRFWSGTLTSEPIPVTVSP